jgi:sporulation protein YlmC with PRC-barrel domain
MRLSDLLGAPVRTEAGDTLGHVHDLRGEVTADSLRITGIVVGPLGVLERFGIGAPQSAARIRPKDVLDWSVVIRADRRGIVVRDDASAARSG